MSTSPISDDPDDVNALTPGHFLIGESLITLPEPQKFDENATCLKRWEMVQQKTQNIWERWHKEYIYSLMVRNKWESKQRNLQPNDLVIIREDNMPPSMCILANVAFGNCQDKKNSEKNRSELDVNNLFIFIACV